MTVTPLGWDQDCSLKNRAGCAGSLGSWILDVGARPLRLDYTSSSLESVPCPFQNLEQPICPSTEEWIKKMWYIYTMEYYSAEKNNNIIKFAGKWKELENIILSEVTQTQKDKHGDGLLNHGEGTCSAFDATDRFPRWTCRFKVMPVNCELVLLPEEAGEKCRENQWDILTYSSGNVTRGFGVGEAGRDMLCESVSWKVGKDSQGNVCASVLSQDSSSSNQELLGVLEAEARAHWILESYNGLFLSLYQRRNSSCVLEDESHVSVDNCQSEASSSLTAPLFLSSCASLTFLSSFIREGILLYGSGRMGS
ncbi:hypothetical protein STEG23_001781 [Scotinomys teguina]